MWRRSAERESLTERKLLTFPQKEAARLIIKCNDFGAGGVSVAVGELADGMDIYLDKVPKIFGTGRHRACHKRIPERMAVVIHKSNLENLSSFATKKP